MAVFLDDQPLTESLGAGATIDDVVRRARARLEGSGRILLGLRCDGQDMLEGNLEDLLAQPVDRFDKLELFSGSPRRAVRQALEEVRRSFADTFAATRVAADAIVTGDIAGGMNTLLECLAIWSRVNDSIRDGGTLAGLDLETLEIAGRPVVSAIADFTTSLRSLRSAIESRDYVVLGDILRYEFDDSLQALERVLDGLIEQLGE